MSEHAINAKMLYLVGGPGNADRVDISDLFANRLASYGMSIDYIVYTNKPAPVWTKTEWNNAVGYVVGRVASGGIKAAVTNKMIEIAADIRTFWLAFTGDYDIIQIRDKFVSAVLGLVAAKLRGKKFVYWISYPFAEARMLDAKEGRALVPWISMLGGRISAWLLYKIIMPNADHNFVQSQKMLEDIAAEGVKPKLMTPVPMGVDDKLLDYPLGEVIPETILYLGTLIRVRRLDMLIEAFAIVNKRFPNSRLIFVGDSDIAGDKEFLEEKAKQLRLLDKIEFTGMIPMPDAHNRVSKAAICLSPFYPTKILLSTSPTKISEYMALGRPVIASMHPEQKTIIDESGAGLCVEWSVMEFADAMIDMLDDPSKTEEMASRGRSYVRDNRTYPIIAQNLASRYQALMDDSL